MEGYLTREEVARYYRTTVDVIRYWRYTGYGPKGVRIGRRVLYPESEIKRFDKELLQGGGEAA